MKTKLILVGLSLILVACSILQKESAETRSVEGYWQEYVLIDSSFKRIDESILTISKTDDFYQIESGGAIHYSYSHIHLTDNNFTFQRSHLSESNHTSIVAYNLFVNSDYSLMNGTSYSDQGVTLEIEYRVILEE